MKLGTFLARASWLVLLIVASSPIVAAQVGTDEANPVPLIGGAGAGNAPPPRVVAQPPEGRKVAALWDPAKDQASGNACKSYAAPEIMQVPGRLHIYWQDDNTLRVDTDSGTQTRLFHFSASPPPSEASTWQGFSVASWEGAESADTRDGQGGPVQDADGRRVPGRQMRQADYLKVVTTHLKPGYLQKNGIPFSANAILEEDFDTFTDPYTHSTWLTVASKVTDPQYLIEPHFMHAHFFRSCFCCRPGRLRRSLTYWASGRRAFTMTA